MVIGKVIDLIKYRTELAVGILMLLNGNKSRNEYGCMSRCLKYFLKTPLRLINTSVLTRRVSVNGSGQSGGFQSKTNDMPENLHIIPSAGSEPVD